METLPKPRVTVVMPAWVHSGDHIADAIASVREQTFRAFDFVLVIDGPSNPKLDAAVIDVLGDPVSDCGRGVIRLPKNVGTAAAINAGFEHEHGTEFLTWISADNVLNPSFLDALVGFLDSNPSTDAVYSQYIRDQGEMVNGHWHSQKRTVVNNPYQPLVDDVNCFIGPSFLWRRRLVEKVGPQRGAIAHDYDYWLRLEEAGRIDWLPRALVTYRVHDDRATVRKATTYDARHWQAEARLRRAGKL